MTNIHCLGEVSLKMKEHDSISADQSREMDPAPITQADLSLAKVAAMFRVSRLRLRYFEFRRLIKRRLAGRMRIYDWTDCDRIAFIIKGRRLGIPLSEIEPIILATSQLGVTELRARAKSQCALLIDLMQQRKLEIDDFIGELEHRFGLIAAGRSDAKYPIA
jgi:DNA-binding transcriptional MerR regulator